MIQVHRSSEIPLKSEDPLVTFATSVAVRSFAQGPTLARRWISLRACPVEEGLPKLWAEVAPPLVVFGVDSTLPNIVLVPLLSFAA